MSGAVVWRWTHQHGSSTDTTTASTSVFERFFPKALGGKIQARSVWENMPVARDAHLIPSNPPNYRFNGLTANGWCKPIFILFHLFEHVRFNGLTANGWSMYAM